LEIETYNTLWKIFEMKKAPAKKTIADDQWDENGNLVCPTCKKPLKGLQTDLSDSLIADEKHTTKKRKVQCCSEECTAKYFEKQQKYLEDYDE
jgi:hypothetical protein